jgi:hypothetical protein
MPQQVLGEPLVRVCPKHGRRFIPLNLGFSHDLRTIFDTRALVRARVRFRAEYGHPVAWLDDLHSMNANFVERGDQRGAWTLARGAPYKDGISLHTHVAGAKICRGDDRFHVFFYGPRPLITCEEPKEFETYFSVLVNDAVGRGAFVWQTLGTHGEAFAPLVERVVSMIMRKLLDRDHSLVAQTEHDKALRCKWSRVAVVVYKTSSLLGGGGVTPSTHPDGFYTV